MILTNSTFRSTPIRIFLDTTFLLGSLLKDGLQRQLLNIVGASNLVAPVVSKVCLYEFCRKAFNGVGPSDRIFQYEEIAFFLNEYFGGILDDYPPVNSVVGRYSVETISRENRPIGEVLVELSDCTPEQALKIVQQQEMNEPLHKFDQNDFHVWVTAIQTQCDYIVTSNTRRFPKRIGDIQRIHPYDFFHSYLVKWELRSIPVKINEQRPRHINRRPHLLLFSPCFHIPDLRHPVFIKRGIMRDDDNRAFIFAQGLLQHFLCFHIQMVRRLVENEAIAFGKH